MHSTVVGKPKMSWTQRPFTKAASIISDAATGTASAVTGAVAAVPQTAAMMGTAVRASVPGLPAGGSLNPLDLLPNMEEGEEFQFPDLGLPDLGLPDMPELPAMPALPKMPSVGIPVVSDVSFKNVGVPFGEWVGLPEGKSLLPTAKFAWSEAEQQEEEAAEVRDLSRNLDLDVLRVAFTKYAGADERMDEEEFKRFAKSLKMEDRIAEMLWRMFDMDGNGVVDSDEFAAGLMMLTQARAWLRYCPQCSYGNDCDYCVEVKACKDCTPERFCPEHWEAHPGRY